MITTRNNIFYINTLNYNKNNNIYNTNNTIFNLNTLNYKKKNNNIYNTHYYINTCDWVWTRPTYIGVGHGRLHTHLGCGRGYVPQGGTGVCLAQWSSPSARWRSVSPAQGLGSLSASYPCVGSVRCPLLMACSPTKICADHFLP